MIHLLVLVALGLSISSTQAAHVTADDLGHEVTYAPPTDLEPAAAAASLAPDARATPPVSADCAAKRDVAGSDVVLLMGQSNMSGRGLVYDPAIDGPNNPRIRQWSRANTIVTAREHLQHHDWHRLAEDNYVGMGTAFGRAYVETLPGQRDVLLVPTAHGGTALVNGPWSPRGYLFEDAMTRVEAALASGEGEQGNCVAAVLWHQGEADANRHVDQEAYQSAWTDMIGAVRDRIPGADQAPAVLGEFSAPWVQRHQGMFGPVIAAIRAIPKNVAFTAVASADGLSVNNGTSVHFDSASQREFGQRYFDKLGEAIGNDQFWVYSLLSMAFAECSTIMTAFETPSAVTGEGGLKENYSPGDLGFDPFGIKPKTEAELDVMKIKELNNGRFAMIRIAGMLVYELVKPGSSLLSWAKRVVA